MRQQRRVLEPYLGVLELAAVTVGREETRDWSWGGAGMRPGRDGRPADPAAHLRPREGVGGRANAQKVDGACVYRDESDGEENPPSYSSSGRRWVDAGAAGADGQAGSARGRALDVGLHPPRAPGSENRWFGYFLKYGVREAGERRPQDSCRPDVQS